MRLVSVVPCEKRWKAGRISDFDMYVNRVKMLRNDFWDFQVLGRKTDDASTVSLGLGLVDMCGWVTCSATKESYVLGAHDLKLQREVASDGGCFFQKIARIGESPRPHCLREKNPWVWSQHQKGIFWEVDSPLLNITIVFCEWRDLGFTSDAEGAAVTLASVFMYCCRSSQTEIETGKTQLPVRKEAAALHPSGALVAVLWEAGCAYLSRASPAQVATTP